MGIGRYGFQEDPVKEEILGKDGGLGMEGGRGVEGRRLGWVGWQQKYTIKKPIYIKADKKEGKGKYIKEGREKKRKRKNREKKRGKGKSKNQGAKKIQNKKGANLGANISSPPNGD